jgi:hypothetical protein
MALHDARCWRGNGHGRQREANSEPAEDGRVDFKRTRLDE